MPYTYQFARPALTVDCVVFGLGDEELKVLLIQRDRDPFAGRWALPGGFVDVGETPYEAARRELEEETGLRDVHLEQLYTFGDPRRDPREHVVSVAHWALVNIAEVRVRAADDARAAGWLAARRPPPLAFDHEEILRMALKRLCDKLRREPIGQGLLPRKFTLAELVRLYETILGEGIDRRAFRRRVLKAGLVIEAGRSRQAAGRQAERSYRFDLRQYRRLAREGFCPQRRPSLL